MADLHLEYACPVCGTVNEIDIHEPDPDYLVECSRCGQSEELGNLIELEEVIEHPDNYSIK